jgi:dTDP-4-amino-4,6-dideoxygalactose transaminase
LLLCARKVFSDVDAELGAITSTTISPLIVLHSKAIAVVHLGGWPVDMPAILNLSSAHGLAVVEDSATAHGGRIKLERLPE